MIEKADTANWACEVEVAVNEMGAQIVDVVLPLRMRESSRCVSSRSQAASTLERKHLAKVEDCASTDDLSSTG